MKTCEWIPNCSRPAVGIGGPHPHHGTANVCDVCRTSFAVPLIKTYLKENQ